MSHHRFQTPSLRSLKQFYSLRMHSDHWKVLPGDHCSVLGCGSCRRTKRQRLNELTKSRVVDAEFKKHIEKDKVFTCEKHFTGEDIEVCKYDRSFPVFTLVVTSNRLALKMIF